MHRALTSGSYFIPCLPTVELFPSSPLFLLTQASFESSWEVPQNFGCDLIKADHSSLGIQSQEAGRVYTPLNQIFTLLPGPRSLAEVPLGLWHPCLRSILLRPKRCRADVSRFFPTHPLSPTSLPLKLKSFSLPVSFTLLLSVCCLHFSCLFPSRYPVSFWPANFNLKLDWVDLMQIPPGKTLKLMNSYVKSILHHREKVTSARKKKQQG